MSFEDTSNADYSRFIHMSRYARWNEKEGRRETWEETVDRYVNFMYNQAKDKTDISKEDLKDLYKVLGATCDE